MRIRYAMIGGAILLALGAAGCQNEASGSPTSREAKSAPLVAPVPVATLVIKSTRFVDTFEVIGRTEPLESVRISADTPGMVVAAPFSEGQTIKRGALLYRVDGRIDAARIELLKSQIATSKRELARLERLQKDGLATPQQLDQAESTLETAQLNLRQAELGLSKTTVTSPISGYVAKKNVDQGEYASPGAALAEIVVYDTIVVQAQVPESQIQHIRRDETLTIEIPALGRSFEGSVKRVGILAHSPSFTYPVEIHIANEDLSILPGMRTRMFVTRKEFNDVIMVPREAILEGFSSREAMVVSNTDEGIRRAELRKVELGPGSGALVLVSEGLVEGDQLITRGHRGLVAGSRIEVVQELQQN
ncbi:MAG: efflux RND transporter periplasmic adaptor subunit [Bradymonadaceae bacterium]|nr:efflux RND transporter periplasmic adaptor subunit [Lujinxingiaceae bacterium]